MTTGPIRPRERDAILQSLRAGVVPRVGLQHIQVGRASEVTALITDLDRLADGGSAIRFVIGEFGSGKTFFLSLVRTIALEKKFVVAQADLTPDRRLHATGGQARALYQELIRNLATRSKPEGGALPAVVERFVATAVDQAQKQGVKPEAVIAERLAALSEMVNGYDFANVIAAYWKGHDSGNEVLQADAIRWLRGEFNTRTDARAALGVRSIVDDANVYDQLKLMARFVRLAGFGGLVVCWDELVNLYKMANSRARNTNYEQILRILNDALQGSCEGLGVLLGGTPEFLMDPRRGLYSYPALQSRLAENRFAVDGLVDHTGPVLRLANLSPEDLYVLLTRLRHVHAAGESARYALPDEALQAFMLHCSQRVGDAYFRTPRNTVTAFINLLSVLEQNRATSWEQLLQGVELRPDTDPDLSPLPDESDDDSLGSGAPPKSEGNDDLASFKL